MNARIRRILHGGESKRALVRWAPIALRLIVGFGFMMHGFSKLSRGPDSFAGILHALKCSGAWFYRVANHSHRVARRINGASALRVQLDQTRGSDFRAHRIRSARI